MLDHRANNKLTGRAAEHSDALCDADRSCEVARAKSVRRKIYRADEREGRAGPLQQSSDIPCKYRRWTEQQAADSKNRHPDAHRAVRVSMLYSRPGGDG